MSEDQSGGNQSGMEDWTSKIEFLTLTVNNFVSENKKNVFHKELCSCKGNFTNGAVEGIQLRCFLKKGKYYFFVTDFWIFIFFLLQAA